MSAPQVGDILNYFDYRHPEGHQPPLPAIICRVWTREGTRPVLTINLTVFSDKGFPLATPDVLFLEDGEKEPRTPYCAFRNRKPWKQPKPLEVAGELIKE